MSSVLRDSILWLSRSERVKHLAATMPVSSGIVGRYVPGELSDDAVHAARALLGSGRTVSLDFLGEDTTDVAQAAATTQTYLDLLEALAAHKLAHGVEVSVKLSAVGQALGSDGDALALDNVLAICRAARDVGTTVTLDMEDHTTTDRTLSTLRTVRESYPETGAVVQAYLHRTEQDCRDLAHEGSRVRLCKGAYDEPARVAYQDRHEVSLSYVRCLKALMAGRGYPMVATHDPKLIAIAGALATRHGRNRGTYEYQMLYGIRPAEQQRLSDEGEAVRVYVPYGVQWYGYLMRRLAERPSNLTFFARSLLTKG